MTQAIFGNHDPVKDLLRELFKNPMAKKLYDDAQRIHMELEGCFFTIKLVDESMLKGFDALANFPEREIQILDTDPFPIQLSSLIFELTNFLQIQRYEELDLRLAKGRYPMRKITYIKLIEKIEYQGCKIHHRVVRHGIKHHNWDCTMDEFASSSKRTFEEDFKHISEDHKEYMGTGWDDIDGPHKRQKL